MVRTRIPFRFVLFCLLCAMTTGYAAAQTPPAAPFVSSLETLSIDRLFPGNRFFFPLPAEAGWSAMDIAVQNDGIYLLSQYSETGETRVEVYSRSTLTLRSVWSLGEVYGAAIEGADDSIAVLSRDRRNWLRLYTRGGTLLINHAIPQRPEARVYGLASDGERFFLSGSLDGEAVLYSYEPQRSTIREIARVPGDAHGLAWSDGRLWLSVERDDVYASQWLYRFDADFRIDRVLRNGLNVTWGLAADDDRLYGMVRASGRILIGGLAVFPDEGVVLFAPRTRDVSLVFTLPASGGGPYAAEWILPLPESRPYSEIEAVSIPLAPAETFADRYGNRWLRFSFERQTGTTRISMSFRITSPEVSWTLARDANPLPRDANPLARDANPAQTGVDPAFYRYFTRPTAVFDSDSPIVLSYADRIASGGTFLDRLLEARRLVNDRLEVVGPSESETTAAYFLGTGFGRCYAHTVALAAVGRAAGLPVRAIGGMNVAESAGDASQHTWNQVWFPGLGWIDVDAQMDDDPDGEHGLGHIGYRSSDYWITYAGEYDEYAPPASMACRGWTGDCVWRDLDRQRGANAGPSSVAIVTAEVLPTGRTTSSR